MKQNLMRDLSRRTTSYQASVGMVFVGALCGDETANYEFNLMTKEGVRIDRAARTQVGRSLLPQRVHGPTRTHISLSVVGIGQDIMDARANCGAEMK